MTPEQATRFLLLAGRTIQQRNEPYLMLLKKLRRDIETLEAATYEMFDVTNSDFRNELYKLHNVPEEDKIRDELQDILSEYFFADDADVEACMVKFRERLDEIMKDQ